MQIRNAGMYSVDKLEIKGTRRRLRGKYAYGRKDQKLLTNLSSQV
jgi:hypothetical protein